MQNKTEPAEKSVETAEVETPINPQRRQLLSVFGLLSSVGLAGCLDESRPEAEDDTDGQTNGRMQNGNMQDVNCGCMSGGPPGGTPATPGSPGTGMPATPGTPAIPATPATPGSLEATFSSVGPDAATVAVADMMSAITLSDGRIINAWSFTSGGAGFNGNRLTPGPVVECLENAPMQLTLSSMMPHTIHLHGLDVDTLNDGVPATSFYVAGGMMGVTPPMAPPSVAGYASVASPFTYNFTPHFAGTYMYHCHVDTVLHMEMGMSGTIIVRPADGSTNTLWTGGPQFDKEYVWQLHTLDSSWHGLMLSSAATARYRPDYFLINGLEGTNLLTDTATAVQATTGDRVLIRLVNLGYLPAEVYLGGLTFDVVSSDGRPLLAPISTTQFTISPGERFDVLFTMPDALTSADINYSSITGLATLGTATTVIMPV